MCRCEAVEPGERLQPPQSAAGLSQMGTRHRAASSHPKIHFVNICLKIFSVTQTFAEFIHYDIQPYVPREDCLYCIGMIVGVSMGK